MGSTSLGNVSVRIQVQPCFPPDFIRSIRNEIKFTINGLIDVVPKRMIREHAEGFTELSMAERYQRYLNVFWGAGWTPKQCLSVAFTFNCTDHRERNEMHEMHTDQAALCTGKRTVEDVVLVLASLRHILHEFVAGRADSPDLSLVVFTGIFLVHLCLKGLLFRMQSELAFRQQLNRSLRVHERIIEELLAAMEAWESLAGTWRHINRSSEGWPTYDLDSRHLYIAHFIADLSDVGGPPLNSFQHEQVPIPSVEGLEAQEDLQADEAAYQAWMDEAHQNDTPEQQAMYGMAAL
jgi:hypothetical protein